jgi:hypothetical protein
MGLGHGPWAWAFGKRRPQALWKGRLKTNSREMRALCRERKNFYKTKKEKIFLKALKPLSKRAKTRKEML